MLVVWISVAVLGVLGCQRATPEAPPAVESVAERGPLEWRVTVAPREPSVGDAVVVELAFRAPADHVAELPEIPELDAFDVVSVGDVSTRATEAGDRVTTQRIELVALLSGEVAVPALDVRYGRIAPATTQPGATQPGETQAADGDNADDPGADAGVEAEPDVALDRSLASERIRFVVRSELTDADDMLSPRAIADVERSPQTIWDVVREWAWYGVIGAVALVAAVALYYWLRRERRLRARALPPEAWAHERLAEIEREQLWQRDAREHYYRLSEILRTYIELKFALAAGEMTTEEFLRALVAKPAAVPFDPQRLRVVLEQWDLAKYAGLDAGPHAAQESLEMAREFVNTTARAAAERAAQEAASRKEAAA